MHTPTNNLFDLPPPVNPLLTRGTAQVSYRNRDPIINPAHRVPLSNASVSTVPVPAHVPAVRHRSTSRGRSSSRGRAVSRGRGRSSRSSSRGRGRAVSRGNTRRARNRSTSRSRSINRVSSHTLKIPSPEIQ